MTNIFEAAVYVGTYKKYNNSSLGGKWFKLGNYKTKADFIADCLEYHNDEREPELMFQDWDNIPDQMISEGGYIDERAFTIIQALNETNALDFALFCDGNGYIPSMEAFKVFKDYQPKTEKPDKKIMEEYFDLHEQRFGKPSADYERATISNVIRMTNGELIAFEKPVIETNFCFGYGAQGCTYDQANAFGKRAQESEAYFMSRNLEDINRKIADIAEWVDIMGELYYEPIYECPNIVRYHIDPELYEWQKDKVYLAPEADKKILLAALRNEKAKFQKRLQAYYKRYGSKAIKTWTYWRDE